MKATWTIRVDRMPITLAVGVHAEETEPQLMLVSVYASGDAAASPGTLKECFDYEPLCRWLTEVWPKFPHVQLLETRINELFEFVFGFNAGVQEAWVGLYKQRYSHGANLVGMERSATRLQFEQQKILDEPQSNAQKPTKALR